MRIRTRRAFGAAVRTFALAVATAGATTASALSIDLFVSNTSTGEVYVLRAAAPTTPELIVNGLTAPTAIAFDSGGDLYVADAAGLGGGSGHIYRFTSGGTLGTVYASGFDNVTDLGFTADGTLWVTDTERGGDGGIFTVAAGGGAATQFNGFPSDSVPAGVSLAFDAGNVFVGDTVLDQVISFDRDDGSTATLIFEDIPELEAPEGLAFDGLGNLALAAGVSEPGVSGRIYLIPVTDADGAGPGVPVGGVAIAEFNFGGPFDIPLDLVIDPGNGNYLVTTLFGEILEHAGATEVSRFSDPALTDPNSLAFQGGFAPGVQTIPEPGTAALFALGLGALALRRRRAAATVVAVLALGAAPAAEAVCPVPGGPTAFTGTGDVLFASSNPDPLTASPTGPGAIPGGWQVAGPGGDAANVSPFAPRAFVELDCGAPGEPACDGSHVPAGSAADGTWTVSYASGTLPPGSTPEFIHWRIAGKRGVAQISNPMVGAWIFNQHDAGAVNPVGTSIQYSATTPELSTLPGQPGLPAVFSFNPVAAGRTCHYPPNASPTQQTLGDQWCNSDKEFFDPNEQARVAASQLRTVPAHAEFCTAAVANQAACLQAWPYVVPARNVDYPEGERYEFYWTNRSGTRLHGTFYTPAGVYLQNLRKVASQPGFTGFPTVSIAGGVISHQPHYYWAAEVLARNGYLVLLYDTAGQGRSNTGGGGFAPDLQDSLDLLLSTPSNPYAHHNPLQEASPHNPFWQLVDPDRLGIAGHSAGGGASNSVQASDAHRLKAGVIWGSGGPGTMRIPYMVQSADNDDFIFPTGSNFGQSQYNSGYDPADPQPRFILQLKDSTHIGWSIGPFYYYTCEHVEIASHYTLAWFDRYLKGGTPAELADAEARITALLDPDPGDGRPAEDYYSDGSCTRYDLDADGQSRTLKNEPGSECQLSGGRTNSPTDD